MNEPLPKSGDHGQPADPVPAPPGRAEIKIVKNKPQIGFASAQIGQHRLLFFFQNGVDRGLYQLR